MTSKKHRYVENFGQEYADSLPLLGQTMAQVLKFFGCDNMYGVGGDYAANLINALSPELNLSASGNEMHAGFTACGQAEISGIGACLMTYTVGSLPCTSAAALAVSEQLPVIFISGAPGESEIGNQTVHHTVAPSATWNAEYDCALNAFKSLGMKAERLQGARTPEQPNLAGEHFFQLVRHAYLHKQPVFIEVPRDLVFEPTQSIDLPNDLATLSHDNFVLKGAELIAKQISTKLNSAYKPLVFIGDNLKLNKRLCDLIVNFCHKQNIPYAATWLAKGIFDEYDPLFVGCYNGVMSNQYVRSYVEEQVDYILEVDTSVYRQDINTAFNTGTHIVDDFENKTVIKGHMHNQQGLLKIFDLLNVTEIKTFNSNVPHIQQPEFNATDKVDFHNIMSVLNNLQQQSQVPFIYMPEIGNSYFASYSLVTKQSSLGRSWLTNPWYAAMGTSLPYARAVSKTLKQKGLPDVPVVITGDGGFNFQLNELIHFQREGLPLTIIYMRNDVYHLGKSGNEDIYHCSTPDFDVLSLIKAYGGHGVRCQTVEEFQAAFSQASQANDKLTLIEVPAEPTEQYQCFELTMLNLYIKAKNGDEQAQQQWRQYTNIR